MDEGIKYTLIIIGVILFALIITALIIKRSIEKDERDKQNNKRVILFNRRTREVKEIFNKNYIESKSWEVVATINDNVFDEFIVYLKRDNNVDEENKYIGKASKGIVLLRWKFKRFIDEISEIEY